MRTGRIIKVGVPSGQTTVTVATEVVLEEIGIPAGCGNGNADGLVMGLVPIKPIIQSASKSRGALWSDANFHSTAIRPGKSVSSDDEWVDAMVLVRRRDLA